MIQLYRYPVASAVLLVSFCCPGSYPLVSAFVTVQNCRSQERPTTITSLLLAKKKDGYRFGDISRGLIGKLKDDVNSMTGKKEYEFGDFTRWLGQKGSSSVLGMVQDFTRKPNYKFGDLSREVLQRLRSGEYSTDDIMLVLKIVAVVGANFQPVAALLPIKVLVEMVEVSLAQDLSKKVVGLLTSEVDSRMKEMVTGDKDYKFGDITKKALTGSKDYRFGDFTKSIVRKVASTDYEFGDITRNILKAENKAATTNNEIDFEKKEAKTAIEDWDEKYLASKQDDSAIMKLELEVWDQKLVNSVDQGTGKDIV